MDSELSRKNLHIKVAYTNWRGETSLRTITPDTIYYGVTEWHPEPQWLLRAYDHDKHAVRDFALKGFGLSPERERELLEANNRYQQDARDARAALRGGFQDRVAPFMLSCFGMAIAGNGIERNHRFLEESLELVQALGCTASEAHQLVDYVFNRPVGEPHQEAGGVMVTFAALCNAHGINGAVAADNELTRCWSKIEKIRAKQAAKPKHSPLPAAASALTDIAAERKRQIEAEGWTLEHDDAHSGGEMARAAGVYAVIAGSGPTDYRNALARLGLNDILRGLMEHYWPWLPAWFKPTSRRRDLVKAGALIVAEIDRLDRAAARQAEKVDA